MDESPESRTLDAPQHDACAALMRRIAGGDQAALAELYDATNRLIFGLVYRVLQDRGSAEEALLDVYTQAWRQASDHEQDSALAWLIGVARTRAIQRLRSGKREPRQQVSLRSETGLTVGDQEAPTVVPEQQILARSALSALAPEERQAIELAYYSGLSHSEIAVYLRQRLDVVKNRARLGIFNLRELLKPVGLPGA